MKTLDVLRNRNTPTEVVTEQKDLDDLMGCLFIGLSTIRAIEKQTRELLELTDGRENMSGFGKLAIIEAGDLALIQREHDQLYGDAKEVMERCTGAKVKITSSGGNVTEAAPQIYDRGERYGLGPDDAVEGVINGFPFQTLSGRGQGSRSEIAISLDEGTSTVYPEKEPSSPASPIEVTDFFTRDNISGRLIQSMINLELVC